MIVIQEIFGVNHHIKEVCRRFAREGYLAMAPEIFHRKGKHITAEYGSRDAIMPFLSTMKNEDLISDVRDVMDFLPEIPHADAANVFIVGFCVGGFASVLAATELSLSGAISFYGAGVVRSREGISLRPYLDKLADVKCPLLLFYGEMDASIPESDRFEIRRVLDENHVPHEFVVYGHADHGFFCDERKSFNAEASQDAWKKVLSWTSELQP